MARKIRDQAQSERDSAARARLMKAQAEEMPRGPEREALLKHARQLETASHLSDWVQSDGLRPPQAG